MQVLGVGSRDLAERLARRSRSRAAGQGVREPSMHRLAIAGILLVLSVSGCAWMKGTATSEGRRDAQETTPPPASTPPTPVATPPSPASTLPTEAGSSTDNGSERSSTPAKASDAAAPAP